MKHQHEALTSWASGQEAIWQQRGQSKCKCLLVYGVWPKVPLPPSSARTEPPPRLVCDDCTRHLQSSCQRGVPRDAGGREGATHNLARQVTRYTVLVSTPLVFILLVAPLLQTAVTRIKNIYKILFYKKQYQHMAEQNTTLGRNSRHLYLYLAGRHSPSLERSHTHTGTTSTH